MTTDIVELLREYSHPDKAVGCRMREAAAEIERLTDALHYEIRQHRAACDEARSLRAEVERERMRLAACGVIAMANTPESAEHQRKIHPGYRSDSFDEVAKAVDREMALRAEVAALRSLLDCRAGRLLQSQTPFFVVKASEPYASLVVALIREYEGAKWTDADEQWAKAALAAKEGT